MHKHLKDTQQVVFPDVCIHIEIHVVCNNSYQRKKSNNWREGYMVSEGVYLEVVRGRRGGKNYETLFQFEAYLLKILTVAQFLLTLKD